MRRLSAGLMVWLIAVGLLAVACSGVPDSGPVHRAADVIEAESSSTRFVPAGPTDGASPSDIVQGYIESMLGFPSDPQITAAFLTDEAAEAWRPSARTMVYESVVAEVPDVEDDASGSTARLEISDLAMLDENGRFGYQQSSRQLRLNLVQHDGQWRITNPPHGLLLSERYFEENVRPAEIFFFDETGDRLIGDPVHVIDDDRAATRLVTALLAGPAEARAAELETFVPEDQTLRGEVEVVDDQVAEVRVRQSMAQLDARERERFVAQITATLIQLDSVDSVRVIAPGTDVVATSASISDLRSRVRSSDVYALRGERLVQLHAGEVVPVDAPWDTIDVTAREVSVDADAERIALIEDDGVEVRGLDTGAPIVALEGRAVISAVWDPDSVLWVVDRGPGDELRIRVVVDDEISDVDSRPWTMADVDSFDLSPDGARYALVSSTGDGDRRVLSGAVRRERDGSVIGVGEAAAIGMPDFQDVASVMWVTSSEIAIAARANVTGFQPLVVRHDGWRDGAAAADRPAVPTQTGRRAVALRPRSGDVYVEDDEGVWAITASRPWELLEGVRAPVRAH